uniref:Transposase n=1 Tax=Steinernema glaseri TaxID=37863 RepID=A0A1I8A523_9BILA
MKDSAAFRIRHRSINCVAPKKNGPYEWRQVKANRSGRCRSIVSICKVKCAALSVDNAVPQIREALDIVVYCEGRFRS